MEKRMPVVEMKKIKFCHFIDSSGFNPLLFNSIKYSNRDRFEYVVVSLEKEGDLHLQLASIGVRALSLNFTSKKDFFKSFVKMYRFLRREKIQILQTHLMNSSLIGLPAAKLANTNVKIFTGHHSGELATYNRKLLTFIDGLNGRVFADWTIAPSNFMKEIFVTYQNVPENKIVVLAHGFDLKHWESAAGKPNSLKKDLKIEDKIIFGAVGRIVEVKKLDILIKAFAEVANKYNNVVLIIAGDGDKTRLTNLIKEKKLEDKVFLIGNRKDIAGVINSFDILVHSAQSESFGQVFIEAFALGKPIVSTKVGVARDIVKAGINGFLVENLDDKSLATEMMKILEQKENFYLMGQSAKKEAGKFDIKTTQKLCDEFYLDCLSKSDISFRK